MLQFRCFCWWLLLFNKDHDVDTVVPSGKMSLVAKTVKRKTAVISRTNGEGMQEDETNIFHSLLEFHDVSVTDTEVHGWVSSEDDLEKVLEAHSIQTLSQFVSWHEDKKKITGTRLFWSHKNVPLYTNTIPFTINRHIIRMCSYGRPHSRKVLENVMDDNHHSYAQKKRPSAQPSRKVSCGARLIIRYITLYPDYQEGGSRKRKEKAIEALQEHLRTDPSYAGEARIFISLPLQQAHKNHELKKESVFSRRVDKKVITKIHELVQSGITNVPLIKKTLKTFVETEYAHKSIVPSTFDRAYYPLSKDIKNHVYSALLANRLAGVDQENLAAKIKTWQSQDKGRLFFFRPASVNEENSDEKFLFVFQEEWQQKLLNMYGNTICLLDATYKTTKYALPFFLLVVKTNVAYLPVAQFILEDEVTTSIQEAISTIKEWNPTWKPAYFMVDYCEAEINAIEAEFNECNVLQCSFHREQAWERWSKSDCKVVRDEFLEKMRHIAYAKTPEEYERAYRDLSKANWYAENPAAQNYIRNRWINIKERWCVAFKDIGFHSMVTTTNGVETLNKSLKYSYLKLSSTGTLVNMIEVVVKDFLKDLFQNYAMLNCRSSCNYKAYSSGIPQYLHNRPRHVVEHCMIRLCSSEQFNINDIERVDDSTFEVNSKERKYSVDLGSECTFPFCQCDDFQKSYLPCKHFFAVFQCTDKSWDDLSPLYKDSPFLTIDENVLSSYGSSVANMPQSKCVLNKEHSGGMEKEIRWHQQELLSQLKAAQNIVYNLSNIEILKEGINWVTDFNEKLLKGCPQEDGLPIRQTLRQLPRRRRKLHSNTKRRVGKKASELKDKVCTGLPLSDPSNLNNERGDAKQNNHKGIETVQNENLTSKKDVLKIAKKSLKRNMSSSTAAPPSKIFHYENLKKKTVGMHNVQEQNYEPLTQMDNYTTTKLVQKLWSLDRDYDVPVAKIENHIVTDTDIRSLAPCEWLTDRILDTVLLLLASEQNDTGRNISCFVQTTMNSIINRQLKVDNMRGPVAKLSECEIVVGAYHRSGHWTLVIAEMRTGKLYFYNPSIEQDVEKRKILNSWRYFVSEHKRKFEEDIRLDWTIQTVPHTYQTDSYNCGVYCLMFAEKHLQGDFASMESINAADLLETRKKIASKLMQYEVFLTGCCPKCGFVLGDDMGIQCNKCERKYHFKAFCVEEDLDDFGGGNTFICRLCRIGYWDGVTVSCIQEEHRSSESVKITVGENMSVGKKEKKKYDLRRKPVLKEVKLKPVTNEKNKDLAVDKLSSDDEDDDVGFSQDKLTFKNMGIVKHLNQIMLCDNEKCEVIDHERHHEFTKNPLSVYNRERRTFGFGHGALKNKKNLVDRLHRYLSNEMIVQFHDKKKPYTGTRGLTIRNLPEGKLFNIFKEHAFIAEIYLVGILHKEALVFLLCHQTNCPYEYANEKCKQTEENINKIIQEKKMKR